MLSFESNNERGLSRPVEKLLCRCMCRWYLLYQYTIAKSYGGLPTGVQSSIQCFTPTSAPLIAALHGSARLSGAQPKPLHAKHRATQANETKHSVTQCAHTKQRTPQMSSSQQTWRDPNVIALNIAQPKASILTNKCTLWQISAP